MSDSDGGQEVISCGCMPCTQFSSTVGQINALIARDHYKDIGQKAVDEHLFETMRALKRAWACLQMQRSHQPRGFFLKQALLQRHALLQAPAPPSTAGPRPISTSASDAAKSMHPARTAMLKRPVSSGDLDGSDAAYTAKRARVDSLIDAGRALATAGTANTDVVSRERLPAPSTARSGSSKEHYRPSPMFAERSVTLDSYRPNSALIDRLATIDSYRPLPATSGDRSTTVDSYRPPAQRPARLTGGAHPSRPPSAPKDPVGGVSDIDHPAHPPAHWRGGWDRDKDSILVRSPKVRVATGSALPLLPTLTGCLKHELSSPESRTPGINADAVGLLRSSSPLPSAEIESNTVGKATSATSADDRAYGRLVAEIAGQMLKPGQKSTLQLGSNSGSGDHTDGTDTNKDRSGDLEGRASFGTSACCGACGAKNREVWSLCVCNNRMCCDCWIKLCVLDEHWHCVTCGGEASFILTESVELRHDDFRVWDMQMQDFALAVHYSTEITLQAVIDRLQDVPWACDLWKGEGSTTMEEAFVDYV